MATAAKTTYTTVTMDDGSVLDFPGKRRQLKNSTIHSDGSISVRMDFVNGETRTYKINPDLVLQFAAHGAEQKFGDETAGLDDIDDAILAVDELQERLERGEWAVKREASGLAGTSILARALVEFTGKSAHMVRDQLKALSQAQKVALRQNPKIQPIVARLEAAKNSKTADKVDTEALLEGFAG